MQINLMPKTLSGKWSVGFAIVLVVVIIIEFIFAVAIGGDPAVIASSPLLSILANALSIMFTLAGPLSLFLGIYTIVKHKDRSVIKPLLVSYVLTAIMFVLGEFIFPH